MGRHADEASVNPAAPGAGSRDRRNRYVRARSRAVHAATQELRVRHRAEYSKLLDEALKREGLDVL